ncbi:MAG: hypothetical protein BVN34_09530 [Proteobacteria bacterium ST_bin12]|nr:MAG: hypothetical protein BVN34_09530 [Proteobacteria bacterium ST_bin12]
MSEKVTQDNLKKVAVDEKLKIVVSATFTIDYLLPSLNYLLDFTKVSADVELAPYHQVFQQLLDPFSTIGQNNKGINICIVRIEDFFRDQFESTITQTHIEKIASELIDAVRQFNLKVKSSLLFAILPCSPRVAGHLKPIINNVTSSLRNDLLKVNGVVDISAQDLSSVSFDVDTGYDTVSDELAHVPFSESTYAALALAIARKVHLLKTPARKVLVLDCDNTIWQGVVGEDGVEGIVLSDACLAIQQFAIDAQSKGVLVCLASKNAEKDVMDVFEKRDDMLLKIQHIVAHRINWEPKYANLQSLASELNLGLDSFVFLDDNPVECGQMRQALPNVVTLQVPKDEIVNTFLQNIWLFDKQAITEEDTKRTQMYRENSARQELESNVTDIHEFLASLDLLIDIQAPDENDFSRVSQLTQRTNQFNFTTIRRSESEIRALAKADNTILRRVKVSDRFGDYGLVGFCIAKIINQVMVVDTLLLSCRVLGRGVEHAILRSLADVAKEADCTRLDVEYKQTSKNEPARAFADSVADKFNEMIADVHSIYRIPISHAIAIKHIPGKDPEAVINARTSETKKITKPLTNQAAKLTHADYYEELATKLIDGQAVLNTLQSTIIRQRDLNTPYIAPQNSIEGDLQALWQSLLGIESIGVEDDYFAIGGTSLLAARLFTEIAHLYNVRLKLTTILDAPTIRRLSGYISPDHSSTSNIVVTLKQGGSKKLFLVHDGDGEILLYRNLALCMPNDIEVFGIKPYSAPNIPTMHNSIESMAAYYVGALRLKQSSGPYYLGGMCAGGLIAYAMATYLEQLGEKVNLVAILDAATPHAAKKPNLAAKARNQRLLAMLQESKKLNLMHRAIYLAKHIITKILNTLAWEFNSRLRYVLAKLRIKVLDYVLKHNKSWPSFLPALTFREIYNSAENQCQLNSTTSEKILLIRAVDGEGDDVAYQKIYADETFGWRKLAPKIIQTDVLGGHASMLQEPNAKGLANLIKERMQADK